MNSIMRPFVAASLIGLVFGTTALPMAASAKTSVSSFQRMMYNPKKTYKDEKVAINDATTRCLTAATKAAHAKAMAQSDALAKKYGITATSTGWTADAYNVYQYDLSLAWDAMNEPYCGFGAFGVTAVLKSYNKSVTRAQTRFTDAMKSPVKLKAMAEEGARLAEMLAALSGEEPAPAAEAAAPVVPDAPAAPVVSVDVAPVVVPTTPAVVVAPVIVPVPTPTPAPTSIAVPVIGLAPMPLPVVAPTQAPVPTPVVTVSAVTVPAAMPMMVDEEEIPLSVLMAGFMK